MRTAKINQTKKHWENVAKEERLSGKNAGFNEVSSAGLTNFSSLHVLRVDTPRYLDQVMYAHQNYWCLQVRHPGSLCWHRLEFFLIHCLLICNGV